MTTRRHTCPDLGTSPAPTSQPHTLHRLIRNWRILTRPFWPPHLIRPAPPITSHESTFDSHLGSSALGARPPVASAKGDGLLPGPLTNLVPRLLRFHRFAASGQVEAPHQPIWPVVRAPGSRPPVVPVTSHEPATPLARPVPLAVRPAKNQSRASGLLARLVPCRPASRLDASYPPPWPPVRPPGSRSSLTPTDHETTASVARLVLHALGVRLKRHGRISDRLRRFVSHSLRGRRSSVLCPPTTPDVDPDPLACPTHLPDPLHVVPDLPARPVHRTACIRLLVASATDHERTSTPLVHPLTRPPAADGAFIPVPRSATLASCVRLRLSAS